MELLSIALTIRYPFGHTTEICSLLHQFSIESLHHIFDYDYGFFLAEVKIIVKTKTEDWKTLNVKNFQLLLTPLDIYIAFIILLRIDTPFKWVIMKTYIRIEISKANVESKLLKV